jgi:Icc-related predicted phosphoesterase
MSEGEITLVIASDTHGDLDKYESIVDVANSVDADVMSLNGDITDRMIGQRYELMNQFQEELTSDLSEVEVQILKEFQTYGFTDDVLENLINDPNTPDEIKQELKKKRDIVKGVAKKRPRSMKRALRRVLDTATQQAGSIASILAKFNGKVAYLRGNHDIAEPVDRAFSKFYALDQKKPLEVKGFRIGGFGYSSGLTLPIGTRGALHYFPHMFQDVAFSAAKEHIEKSAGKVSLDQLVRDQADFKRLNDEECDVLMFHEAPGTLLKRFAAKEFHENYGIAAQHVWRKMREKRKVYSFSGHHHKANVWTKYNAAQTDPETIYVAKLSKTGHSYITPYTWKPVESKVVDIPRLAA